MRDEVQPIIESWNDYKRKKYSFPNKRFSFLLTFKTTHSFLQFPFSNINIFIFYGLTWLRKSITILHIYLWSLIL